MSWRIKMTPEAFDQVRTDPRLHACLNLGRAINALRFSHHAYLASKDDDTPGGIRQRVQGFFLNCATLYEALNALDRLGQYLSDMDVWQEKIKPIQRSRRFRRFRYDVLPNMRDRFVFHFDDDVAPEALERLHLDEYVYAAAAGRSKGDVDFDLADTASLNFLLDRLPDDEMSEKEKLSSLIQDGAELTVEFGNAVESVLAHAALEMGWELNGEIDGV